MALLFLRFGSATLRSALRASAFGYLLELSVLLFVEYLFELGIEFGTFGFDFFLASFHLFFVLLLYLGSLSVVLLVAFRVALLGLRIALLTALSLLATLLRSGLTLSGSALRSLRSLGLTALRSTLRLAGLTGLSVVGSVLGLRSVLLTAFGTRSFVARATLRMAFALRACFGHEGFEAGGLFFG